MTEPNCPLCGSSMVLRTARRGKNAGGQFWGCSGFPICKGIISVDDLDGSTPGEIAAPTIAQSSNLTSIEPIHWRDALPRGGYYSEYLSIGAVPSFAIEHRALETTSVRRAASQALLLSKRTELREVSEEQKSVSSIIQKLLTRGLMPLSTLGVEEALVGLPGVAEHVTKLDERNMEVGWRWKSKPPRGLSREILDAFASKSPLSSEDVVSLTDDVLIDVLDGDNEQYFFSKWLTRTAGRDALHWILPQAELDLILASSGVEQSGQRKIDFLFCHPNGEAFAIELDGEEHAEKARSDEARNAALAQLGIKTIRIPNSELEIGEGPNLSELEQMLRSISRPGVEYSPDGIPLAIKAASMAARFQFALARALSAGQLDLGVKKWTIDVDTDAFGLDIIQAAANDFAEMVGALASMYSMSASDKEIECIDSGKKTKPSNLSISLLAQESPLTVGLRVRDQDYVICPAFAPVEFATDAQKVKSKSNFVSQDEKQIASALLFFLQNLFRKRAFRELQAEAVRNALQGQDTVTLLPTGAGKSIIYQLAGLLQSGITLVVDPIVALMEDQILGLAKVGIDKAGAPPSGFNKTDERRKWLRAVERGDYQFVLMSPERLQMADTREALRALAEVTFVNLAVIDEAHCVSEWGHNFRFSYLNLADNLRNYCRTIEGQSPTLLALTGTASRSVLRELLTELKIGKDQSDALIRPLNFDRNELKFHITKVGSGGDSSAVLRGILNGLPSKFNVPPSEFFQPAGNATNSGIAFTPFVNGRTHGLFAVKSAIQNSVKVPVTTYSGSAPKGINRVAWEAEKRANAKSFKDNEAPILVATKAFGMGIDKPNIRWTIHMGVPSSMEAFYQEAGRAGRDKNLAYCNLIFSEVDAEATDNALASQGSIHDLREAAASFKSNDDDISRALFFHLNAYSGVDEEIHEVWEVLQLIGDLTERKNVEITFDKETKPSIERAILRLIKTGIVDDLEVNFGSKYFLLKVPNFNFESARQKFEQYISDSQPARLKTIVQELDRIEGKNLSAQPIELCSLMINFTYDVIERSRRRMLYEAILLGRNYSKDSEIRQYLLDYLQEGLGAEQIAALAEQQEIQFESWIELFEKVSTPLDAGEIRGIIIRLLETFPDHPGMLAARGISEALVANPDQALIRDSLLSALDSGKNRYSCSTDQILDLLESLLDLANKKSASLRLPLLNALQKSEIIENEHKAELWEKIESLSVEWDDTSKICIAALTTDTLITDAIRNASALINHISATQRELN
jgi:ATP-dependent DNA helicase RecQ